MNGNTKWTEGGCAERNGIHEVAVFREHIGGEFGPRYYERNRTDGVKSVHRQNLDIESG